MRNSIELNELLPKYYEKLLMVSRIIKEISEKAQKSLITRIIKRLQRLEMLRK